jgi:broad specificity phosphatase PhoE
LNPTGRAQVLRAREQLKGRHLSAVYSSDLLRARQTAELLAEPCGLAVHLEPRLREIHLGVWEGRLSDEIAAHYPQELLERAQNPVQARAPGGESLQDVAGRVLRAVTEIVTRHPDDAVLIVAHGISLAVILCQAEGLPLEAVYEHVPDNAQPSCLCWPSF